MLARLLRILPAATPVIQRHQQIRGVVGHRRNDQHARIRELGAERRQIDHRVTRYCLWDSNTRRQSV